MSEKEKQVWKNRIVGSGEKPAKDFKPNPLNWRTHPEFQRRALSGILSEVGWVTGVIENSTTGNVIDGHARIEEALGADENSLVPFIRVELSVEEERKILLLLDPIGAMAASNSENFQALAEFVSLDSPYLLEAISGLKREYEIPEFKEYDESIENEVQYIECPQCNHRFPK